MAETSAKKAAAKAPAKKAAAKAPAKKAAAKARQEGRGEGISYAERHP